MKVIYGIGRIKKFNNPVLAIGVFDGLHRGHQLIIKKVVRSAKKVRGTSIVLTFHPHPNHVLKNRKKFPLLVSLEQRLKLIENLGIDVSIVVNFSKDFSSLSAEDFVKNFLIKKIKPREVFVGSDFAFGKDKSGNAELLRRLGEVYGFKTRQIPPLKISAQVISSTLIRNLISSGQLDKASLFLGRRVSVLGRVVKGRGIGRILGFPTANIYPSSDVLPPSGVYAVKMVLNKRKLSGMAFIRNSFLKPAFEVHAFNFRKNIYSQEIEVEIYNRIRAAKRFKKLDSLKRQIKDDEKEVRKFFLQLHSPPNTS